MNATPLDRARRRAYARVLPVLVLAYVASYLDRTNIAVAKLSMARDLPGFDDAAFGLGAGAFFLGFVLLEIPATVLVERWSARRMLAGMMAAWALCAAATALVRTPMQFHAVRFLLGLAEGAFFPGVVVYLSHFFLARDRTRALGLFVLGSPLAQVVSPKIAGALLLLDGPMRGWQWVYVVSAAPALVLAAVVLATLPDRPGQARWLPDDERATLVAALAAERAARPASSHLPLGRALRDRRVLALAGVHFGAITAFYGVEFFLPTVLVRWYGLSLSSLTTLMAAAAAASLVGVLLVSFDADRTGERRLHTAVPLALAGGALLLLPLAQGSRALAVLLSVLAVVGVKAYLPGFWSLPAQFLGGGAAAASIGFINAFGNLGGFLGPYVIGRVAVATGSFRGGLLFVGAAAVLATVPLLRPPRAAVLSS